VPTFIDILSPERFGTYRGWASGDEVLAIRLYTYNVQLSTTLYGPLHMLEVALRNVADRKLSEVHGPDWYDNAAALSQDAGIRQYQQGCVSGARETLRKARKAGTHCEIITELNFGFWSSLFGKGTNALWSTLRPAFQARGVQRSDISGQLSDLRKLRNRIAHYEPILAIPLGQRYASITTLTGWLSPSAAAWISKSSNWGAVYPGVPILVPDAAGELRFAPAALPLLPA